jgi:hypothetical protein
MPPGLYNLDRVLEGASLKGSGVSHFSVSGALIAWLFAIGPARAETSSFPMIPVIRTQLTISPGTPAPGPRPARPAARPARPAPAQAPAPARSPANPAPAASPPPAPVPDQALREANEQLLKQVGDLAKLVGDLTAQTGNLTAQVSDLNAAFGQLQKQLADTEGRLKDEVDRTAAKPFQALELSGVVEKGVSANIDRLFQSLWPNIAVPAALLLLLCTLLGTMIIGVPVKALLYRVPFRHGPQADRTGIGTENG